MQRCDPCAARVHAKCMTMRKTNWAWCECPCYTPEGLHTLPVSFLFLGVSEGIGGIPVQRPKNTT